jgi:predicted nucleic acid-binding protein
MAMLYRLGADAATRTAHSRPATVPFVVTHRFECHYSDRHAPRNQRQTQLSPAQVRLLTAIAEKEGLEIARLSKSFAKDALLALSCRESGCVLVTDDARDFQRIRRFVPFEFVEPWPP